MCGSLKSPELSEPVELKGAMEIRWQDSDGLVYFRGPFDRVSRYPIMHDDNYDLCKFVTFPRYVYGIFFYMSDKHFKKSNEVRKS